MKTILIIFTIILSNTLSFSQEDAKGSKDHPLFNRMPGYKIDNYEEKEFGVYDKFRDKNGKETSVEGHYYFISYYIKKGEKAASDDEVIRNFINAVTKIGGKVIYPKKDDVYLDLVKDNKETWVRVRTKNRGAGYQMWIIEKALMEQNIVADAKSMLGDINALGRVALYGIYFDFDKSDVKPESGPTLKEISKLLSENPKLKLYVVGHTDNVGDYNYNMKLSQARADAVVKTLVSKYNVDKNSLTPAGIGPLAPVTTNDTEEGKGLNRRVELIKK